MLALVHRATRQPHRLPLLKHLSNQTRSPGLFGLPNLINPDDFPTLAYSAIENANSMRQYLSSPTYTISSKTLYELDHISNTVCSVIDAAELARCVHSSPEFRSKAEEAFQILAEFIATLNSDFTLYNKLQLVDEDESLKQSFTEEETRMLFLLKAEFEREGIHLPEEERNKVLQLNGELSQIETTFSSNIVTGKKQYRLSPGTNIRAMFGTELLNRVDSQNSSSSSGVIVTTDSFFTNTILRHEPLESVRRDCFLSANTSIESNLPVLNALQKCRYEIAHRLNHSGGWAEKQLQQSMAKNATTVASFLKSINQRIERKRSEEFELLGKFKGGGRLEPWDLQFFMNQAKIEGKVGTGRGGDYSSYFSLDNCLQGMKLLTSELFGIEMVEEVIGEDEAWCSTSGNDNTTCVKKFRLRSDSGVDMGVIFLDLLPRENKFGHAAHFTVRCGCKEFDSEAIQTPIVALVMNFPLGGGGLRQSEVKTLFHEFGHALHSLLSRTSFQHLSGTRGSTDFVEMPSHLLEHFAEDFDFVSRFAVNGAGEVVKKDILDSIKEEGKFFEGIDTTTQILYSEMDQQLFGANGNELDSSVVLGELHKNYAMPFATGTHWQTQFGHLVTYGGSYYSYLWSQIMAEEIYNQKFAGNCMSREHGDELWQSVLKFGGSKDPFKMVSSLLGREVKFFE